MTGVLILRSRKICQSDEVFTNEPVIVLLFHLFQEKYNHFHHRSPVQGFLVYNEYNFEMELGFQCYIHLIDSLRQYWLNYHVSKQTLYCPDGV